MQISNSLIARPGYGFGQSSPFGSMGHAGTSYPQPNLYQSTYRSSGKGARSGFMVDLDGNGRMQHGRDGVLAFDLNQDGRVSQKEIRKSKSQMEHLTGTHKDLKSKSPCKKAKAEKYRKKLIKRYDVNRDGKVSNYEMKLKGGQMLVDTNLNGRYESHEAQGMDKANTFSGSFRLNMLGTKYGMNSVSGVRSMPSWGRFS